MIATPSEGSGGGPVATIFDANGNIVRQFWIGPPEDRSGLYQPHSEGASAPDGSDTRGISIVYAGKYYAFFDYDGIRHDDLITGPN
jgi:hypothetical protein